ncbi:MAG: T9SS type A sorting domain-containing protein, partial [Flavobacteriales bacterium]|nr:T9SS type A sorting domain-containing protein [Flavobacteriales bacterium]
ITVTDTTAPVISCPADITIDCSDSQLPANTGSANATDDCSNATITFSDGPTTAGTPACAGNYSFVRTWTATDDCGNTSTCDQTIIITDSSAPVLSGQGADIALNCPGVIEFTPPVALDNCDGDPTILFIDNTVAGDCLGAFTITRTWTAVDACSNLSSPVSQIITVQDSTPPVLDDNPADITVSCNDVPEPPICTATDECDADVQVFYSETSGPDCNFGILRTWTAIDDCGNTSTYTQTITVIDTEDPVIILPPDQTIDCADAIPVPFSLVQDNCDEDPLIEISENTLPGDCPQEFIFQRTFTATDACGNSSSAIETITIVDQEAPVVTLPTPSSVTKECTDIDVSLFDLFDLLEGNLNVQDSIDLYQDILDLFLNCDLIPSATDNCGIHSMNPVDILIEGFNDPSYPESGLLEITWQAEDECGNTSIEYMTSVVVTDSNAPLVVCQDLTLELGPDGYTIVDPLLVNNGSSDDCSPMFFELDGDSLTCENIGTSVASLIVIDLNENATTCNTNLNLVNNNPSGLICPPDIVVGTDPGSCTAFIPANALFGRPSDPCEEMDISHVITFDDGTTSTGGISASGDFPVGTHFIEWTGIGEDGTIHMCSTIVTVLDMDTEAPIVFCQNITVSLNNFEATVPASLIAAFASDNCSSNLTYAVNDESILFFYCDDLGLNTVTLEVTDESGNVGTCASVIEVEDPLGNCVDPEACTTPTDLQHEFFPNAVKLSWTPPAGSEACQITGGIIGGGQASIIKYAPNVFNHFVANNILNPTADYQWRVRCACELDPLDVSPFSPYNYFNLSNPLVENEDVYEDQTEDHKFLGFEESNLVLYPNPNDGEVMEVQITNFEEGNGLIRARVLDIGSKVVHQEQFIVSGNAPRISLEFDQELPAGFYTLFIELNDKVLQGKFIVQ